MTVRGLATIPIAALLLAAAVLLPLRHGTAAGWIAAALACPVIIYGACWAIDSAHGRHGFRRHVGAALAVLAAAVALGGGAAFAVRAAPAIRDMLG